MIGIPDQSTAKCYGQSFALVRRRTITPSSSYEAYIGFVPIHGYGTFINGSDYSAMCRLNYSGAGQQYPFWAQNDIWPNVYQTLTETWNSSDGSSVTITHDWQQNIDIIQTQTVSGGLSSGVASASTTGTNSTSVNCTYTTYAGGTGTYTAILSNPYTPNWSALAVQADSARALLTSADLVNTVGGQSAWAGVTSTGVNKIGGVTLNIYAAAYGTPVRIRTTDPVDTNVFNFDTPLNFYIQNEIAPCMDDFSGGWPQLGIGSFRYVRNIGGIIAASSSWILTGSPPAYGPLPSPGALNGNMNNHLTIYMQQFTPPSTIGTINISTAPGFGVIVPGTYSFDSSDVQTNLGSGNFGTLGFRDVGI